MTELGKTRSPTIIDVARRAGVSKSVVSRVFSEHGSVREQTRQQVLVAAEELGYVVNAMARAMVAHRTHTLGVFVRDAATPFYGHLLTALQDRAAHHGYRVVTATGSGRFAVADEQRALETLVRLQVEALVVCSGLLPVAAVAPFTRRMPVVIAGRPETGDLVSSVFCDEDAGGAGMAEHLLGLGHRNIAVLRLGEEQSLTMAPRTAAMIRQLTEAGANVLQVAGGRVDDVEAPVDEVLARADISAFMTPSDHYALSVLESLRRRHVSVPEQLSVTGYDGIGVLTTPLIGLTTWVQPIMQIGAQAVDAVVAALDGLSAPQRHQPLPGWLLTGRTAAPFRARH
jgi:DNA-binding LacI/PurR family transcriptional regulator